METIVLHLMYGNDFKICDLAKVIDCVSKSFNEISKDNGINRNKYKNYSPIINGVNQGSIILELLTTLAVGTISSLLANHIYNKLSKENIECDIDIKNGEKETKISIRIKK